MTRIQAALIALAVVGACTQDRPRLSTDDGNAGLDSLNARIEQAYRSKDPKAYAALYTDSAVFEWPAVETVRGPAGMEAMARSLWPPLDELDLKMRVASRRIAPDHATEFGSFEESWRDSSGTRMTEYGRYVTLFARRPDGWRIDRFVGFSDSSRPLPPKR